MKSFFLYSCWRNAFIKPSLSPSSRNLVYHRTFWPEYFPTGTIDRRILTVFNIWILNFWLPEVYFWSLNFWSLFIILMIYHLTNVFFTSTFCFQTFDHHHIWPLNIWPLNIWLITKILYEFLIDTILTIKLKQCTFLVLPFKLWPTNCQRIWVAESNSKNSKPYWETN